MESVSKGALPAQYVLAPSGSASVREDWSRAKVGDDFEFQHDSQLSLHMATNPQGIAVALLGYALDPGDAGATDADVVASLAERAHSRSALLGRLGELSGRHIVVVNGPTERYAVADAYGQRQMCWATRDGNVWCASQPALLAEALGLQDDPKATAFASSPEFAAMSPSPGQWWPPYRTPVSGVRHLPPNHLVDLTSGHDERIWPATRMDATDDRQCHLALGHALRGAVLAAARRAPLTLLLTAGHDSRLILAALRPVADQLHTVSIHTADGNPNDWEVPAELAARLGFHHEVADASAGDPTSDFMDRYTAAVVVPDELHAANAEALAPHVAGRLAITGHGAEVGKPGLWTQARFARRRNPGRLSLEMGMGNHPFARNACAEWLDRLEIPGEHVGQVLYWEQRLGSWAANWSLGYDLVWPDCLMPFGNRRMLENLIFRKHGESSVLANPPAWHDLTNEWWPDVLSVTGVTKTSGNYSKVRKARRSLRYLRAR